jgi:hypothetical protein
MYSKSVVIEQVCSLVADLSLEDRLDLIRSIATLEPPAAKKDEAVTEDERQMWAEQEIWFARPMHEREAYRNQYIAVRDGVVIDQDSDQRTLLLRVRKRYNNAPIPIINGNWDAVPTLVIRSPRLVKETE